MTKKYLLTVYFAVLLSGAGTLVSAQKSTPQKPVAKPSVPAVLPDTVKFPKFTVRFGPFSGATPALLDDLKRVLPAGLSVTDQQGQKWTPLAWRFTWNRLEQSNDIRTGKVKTIATSNLVQVDSSAVLPASWQNEIRGYLKTGEEFIIEKIIVEHPGSKRKMLAPDFRIKTL